MSRSQGIDKFALPNDPLVLHSCDRSKDKCCDEVVQERGEVVAGIRRFHTQNFKNE